MSEELTTRNALAKVPSPLAIRADRDLIKAVAMDIGKQVAHHIETMYPDAVNAASSTFLLSVRNCTHNEIMAWIDTEIDAEKLLTFHDRFRRYIRAQYRRIRRKQKENHETTAISRRSTP